MKLEWAKNKVEDLKEKAKLKVGVETIKLWPLISS